MKILVVGGGSGGHVTPAVAVVTEILKMRPRAKIEFWTDKKYYKNVSQLTTEIGMKWSGEEKPAHIRVRKIMAGKYHRYAGWKFSDYFEHLDITFRDLIWGNIKGFFGFVGGIVQSFCRLIKKSTRPDIIFLKGGFVGLPVGLIAGKLKIPYVIHESDAVAGLANRVLMKRAQVIATGFQLDDGGRENEVFTGIPVSEKFKPVTEVGQKKLKKKLGFEPERPPVVVTGGSQGAENINLAIREILPEMLKFTSVGLVAGRKKYEDMVDLKKYENWEKAELMTNFRMWEFCTVMDELLGAADVVISRAGATTIAELAALKKAVILIPFERLAGNHQCKNADKLEALGAAKVIYDSKMMKKPELLLDEVRHLVRSPKERAELAENLGSQAKPEAAKELAEVILGAGD